MSGLRSWKATTTFRVVEASQFDIDTLRHRLVESLLWIGDESQRASIADQEITELCRLADTFPVGTVIEKRGQQLVARSTP